MDVDMLSKGEACLWLSCNRQCVVFSPGNRYNRNKWWGKGNVGTSVQLPRGRVFDNVSVQFPIISPQKRGLKRRLFFLSFVHAKDRKMDSTLSAPGAGFGFIQKIKTWPRRTSQMIPKSLRIALHAKPSRLAKGRKVEYWPQRRCLCALGAHTLP